MTKTALLAATALVALSVAASAAGHPDYMTTKGVVAHHFQTAPGATVLLNQNNSSSNGGVGLVSQNFESSLSEYDASGAVQFVVPAGSTWKVSEVDVTGVYFNGSGPATNETVTFYKDKGGAPGKAVKKGSVTVKGKDSDGSFAITLKKGVKLKAGTYWVGVAANMSFDDGGEWGWEDNTVNSADWENPGGGFGTSCTKWAPIEGCIGYGPGEMVELQGTN
ncbi:MAG: hypothetical protein ABSD74_06690 [Rhizomicrobium sp.]|jgi:hypothetical protein